MASIPGGRTAKTTGVQAVIFDWGGTLTPWHSVDLQEQWRIFASIVAPDDAGLAQRLYDAERDAWSRSESEHSSATFDGIVRAAGGDPTHVRHAAALTAYRDFWEPHTLIDPDVPPLLDALHDKGIGVGVLSNTVWPREYHEQVFARDGVLDRVDGAVYTSEVPWTKPHPEVFHAALAAVGVDDPARAVFVGDRLFDDVSGAQGVGMRAIWVPHSDVPAFDVTPDATVERLADVLTVVLDWH